MKQTVKTITSILLLALAACEYQPYDVSHSSSKLKADNYYFEPGLKVDYSINSILSIALSAGYSVQFVKEVLETDDKAVLTNNNKEIGPDWSGFRFGLSVVVSLSGN